MRRNRRASAAPRARRNTCWARRCSATIWKADSTSSAIPARTTTRITSDPGQAPIRSGLRRALEHQQVLMPEIDFDHGAEGRRGQVRVVERVEQDRIALQPDADADHGTEEAHLVDAAAQAVAAVAAAIAQRDRFGPQGE